MRLAVMAAGTALVLTVAASPTPSSRVTGSDPRAATCTFTNSAFAGECIERTAVPEDSTALAACTAILNCLNDSRCAKTYCRATTVRRGWVLKKVEEGASEGG